MEEEFDEKLESILGKFRNPRRNNSDSYVSYIDEDGDEVELVDEIIKLMDKYHCEYEIRECGCFDSPGYSLESHCIAYIDPKGHLQAIPIIFEIF